MFTDVFDESPILGKSQVLSDEGKEKLDLLISKSPLAVFQSLNKEFNKKGLCTQISSLPN